MVIAFRQAYLKDSIEHFHLLSFLRIACFVKKFNINLLQNLYVELFVSKESRMTTSRVIINLPGLYLTGPVGQFATVDPDVTMVLIINYEGKWVSEDT